MDDIMLEKLQFQVMAALHMLGNLHADINNLIADGPMSEHDRNRTVSEVSVEMSHRVDIIKEALRATLRVLDGDPAALNTGNLKGLD